MTAERDLRGWLRQAEEMGEVVRIEGAHWDQEIGAVTELLHYQEQTPAVLFEAIQGYPRGYRVLTHALGSTLRLALTLQMPATATAMEFIKAWRLRSRHLNPLAPRLVKDGPLLEHLQQGDQIDLLQFPAPRWFEQDGGRYLGTGSMVITRDPNEGWINCGTYRVMVHDRQTLGLYISPGKHGRIHRDGYFARGEACPVAISFGHDPLFFFASSTELPSQVGEYDFVGGIRGEPVELIPGPVTGLPIPANAELAIEGECLPQERRVEGPFGEWTGYYGSSSRPEPVIKVHTLMYRTDPIILGLSRWRSAFRSALVWDELERAGVPDVQGVWFHEAGGARLLMIVAIKQRYPGHARQAGLVASQCRAGAYLGRYVIVVDEDIDPTSTYEVLWAIATRTDPQQSIQILRRCWSGPLDPIIPEGEKGFNSRAIIDACRPYEWLANFPAVASANPQVKAEVMRKWGQQLGLQGGAGIVEFKGAMGRAGG